MADLPTPERVERFLEAAAAPTRSVVLRELMHGPITYTVLLERIGEEIMSRGAVYEALRELTRLGYVLDDMPDAQARKTKWTLYRADRDLVAEDLGATISYFLV